MAKTQLNVRLPETLIQALDKQSEATGKNKTDIVYQALAGHLGMDPTPAGLPDIIKRLEALEAKIESRPITTPKEIPINPAGLGDLITKEEASQITGYSVATFHRSFSQQGITQKGKRGQAGLYSKEEILDKIGIK